MDKIYKFELWEGEVMKCDECGTMLKGDSTPIYMEYRVQEDGYIDPLKWRCKDCMQKELNAGWPHRKGFPPVVP